MSSRFLFPFLVLLGICLAMGLSLFSLNGHKWPYYFDNRVIADKSAPQKNKFPILGDGYQITQTIDLAWANVSNPRLLSQPFCLSLMLSPGTDASQNISTFIEVALSADTHRWTWQTNTKEIGGGYTRFCSANDQILRSLVEASEASIQVTGVGGTSADNLVSIILATANEAMPALVNGNALDGRLIPFKIDAHPSPTITDLFKYAVLLLLAGLMTFVMGLAAYSDWHAQRAEKGAPPTSH